jgi:glycosyltransferase involved in cell wall biosynthesis
MKKKALIYFGYNNMYKHKRGVENVIDFQLLASPSSCNYYIHWDNKTHVSRYYNLICIGIKKDLLWWVSLNFILFKIRIRKINIFIHSHNPLMSLISFYRSNLFTVHDALYYNAKVKRHKGKYVFFPLEILLYLRCDYVHFISDFAKNMSLFRSNKNFGIISNTSHLESRISFKPGSKKTNFIEGNYKIFSVRSIEERALINLIIEVAYKLREEKFSFLIAGKGPLLSFYRDLISDLGLGNIKLLGYLSDEDLILHYRECDLILSPALYGEGFGLPIIEAYLHDKPVIASNVCAIPEVIISNDYLFENNVDSLISSLNFVKTKTKSNYRDYYYSRFSNNEVILKMKALYINLG